MADIRYRFIADGVQTVRDGFRSIDDDAKKASRGIDEAMRRMRTSARETARESGRGGNYQQKLARQVAKDQERAQKYVAGIKDRYFREEQRKEEQAERLAQRNAARAEAQKQRTVAAAVSNRRKEIAREISDRSRHESKLEQISRAAADKRAEGERRHRRKLDEIKRQNEGRLSSIADRAKDAAASRERARAFDNELLSKRRAYEIDKKRAEIRDRDRDEFRSGVGGAIRGAVIGGAVAATALGVGIAGGAARDALHLQEVSNRLSISARGPGEEAIDPNVLRREFEQTAIKTPGVRAIDVADAVSQFVTKTGELDVARKSQGVFATVASATGSSIQDVSAAAADLFQKFDITSVEGMADAMAALAFQGKAGAFELKDAASQFAKLSAAAARFGLDKGAGGVRVLGGLTQIARTSTGSPEQAATAIEAMFRQFTTTHALKQLKAIGVNPFKDKKGTQTRDVRELIVETITKSGGSLTKLQGIFGDEGIRAVSPIITKFNEAQKAAEGRGLKGKAAVAAGSAAARSYIDEMVNAPGDYSELQKDAAQAQQDASAKVAATWEAVTAGVGEKLLPVIARLAEALAKNPGAIEAFVKMVELAANALQGWITIIDTVYRKITGKSLLPSDMAAEAQEKTAKDRAAKAQSEIDKIGTFEKARELEKQGKVEEAEAMRKRLREPGNLERVMELERKRDIALDDAKRVGRTFSADEFAQEYANLGGATSDPDAAMKNARRVATALRDSATQGNADVNDRSALDGETEGQRRFRLAQGDLLAKRFTSTTGMQEKASGTGDVADKGMSSIAEAAAKIMAAATKMEGAAGKMGGQASIVPPP